MLHVTCHVPRAGSSPVLRESPHLQLLQQVSDARARPAPDKLDVDSTLEHAAMVQQIQEGLEEVFLSKGGYRIAMHERRAIEATGGSAAYGELDTPELAKVLGYLGMDQSSVFYDLGSGTGKCVLATSLGQVVRKAVGIELSVSRHEQAEAALQVMDGLGLPHSPVELRNEDIATADVSDGSHFFLCSTAFGASLCRKVAERLSQSSNFQVLVTTRELPFQPYLQQIGDFPCNYSWMANSSAFVYVKSLQAAPASLLAKLYCVDGICYPPTSLFLPTIKLEPEQSQGRPVRMRELYRYARAPSPSSSS
jgi:hypothetical protein